jgi:hypothetical protein
MSAQIVDSGIDRVKSARIVIDAPAAHIFAVIDNPHRHSEIDGSGMVKSNVTGPTELVLGSKFVVGMKQFGISYKQFNKVVEYKKNELIAWNNLSPSIWRYELKRINENSTEVISSYDGRIPWFLHWYANYEFKWAPKALAETLDRLKSLVEGNRPTSLEQES